MCDLAGLDPRMSGSVVLVGVGCPGRGDDGAGCALARSLRSRTDATVIDGGDRPEDLVDEIAGAEAETILIVDAVDMGARPGELAVLDARDIRARACDTHRASLGTLMRYLELRTGATVLMLAIQPAMVGNICGMSAPVAATVERLRALFEATGAGTDQPAHGVQGGTSWTSSSGS